MRGARVEREEKASPGERVRRLGAEVTRTGNCVHAVIMPLWWLGALTDRPGPTGAAGYARGWACRYAARRRSTDTWV